MFNKGKKFMKSNVKGFTFIEVIVVIVIIAILASAWFFTGRGHLKIAMANEGRALIDKIVAQEKIYRVQKSDFFLTTERVEFSKDLKIDARQNKYFKEFEIVRTKNASGTAETMEGVQVIVYPEENDADLSGVSLTGIYKLDSDVVNYVEAL
jgi:prepilin-type N-terminal cleavage/methylation domain-containing protein